MSNEKCRALIAHHSLLITHYLCIFLFCFSAVVVRAGEPLQREVYLMGTTLSISLYEDDSGKGLNEIEQIVKIVEDTEAQLSTWRDSSELSHINQTQIDDEFALSKSLCALMLKLHSWVDATGGAFDPTVGQILQAWKIQSGFQIPQRRAINVAVAQSGFTHLVFNDCSLRKTTSILFDAGAFGKGEALDRVLALAAQENYPPFVLDFGGQIAIWNLSQPLVIELANPAHRIVPSAMKIAIRSGSVSTSGGSERDGHVKGRSISHIVDPRTGYPVPSFGSVTVWNSRALDADILSTALYVMGPKTGMQWAEQNKIAACFLFKNTQKTLMTSAFREMLER